MNGPIEQEALLSLALPRSKADSLSKKQRATTARKKKEEGNDFLC